MRRILLTTIATLGIAGYSFGQGEVLFSARITINGQTMNEPFGYWMFALFYAPPTVTDVVGNTPWLDPRWQFSSVYGTNTILGRMAGLTPGNANSAAVIPGYVAGATASLTAILWNADAGGVTLASFINAYNGGSSYPLWYGYSEIGQPVLGNGASVPNMNLFGAGTGQIPGSFTVWPEPSTFALTCLGGVVLLLSRHRNSRSRRVVKTASSSDALGSGIN